MEHIDWLVLGENAKAAEEDLDRPYAWCDERVYTRREYEKLREEAGERLGLAVEIAHKIEDYDKELFFDNIDYIFEHRNRIYEDRALGLTNTIDFSFSWRYIMIGYRGFSFPVAVMLAVWEKGDWLRKCPKCGKLVYQYKVHFPKGYCCCPHCKEFFTVEAVSGDSCVAKAVYYDFYPREREKKENLSASFSFNKGKHTITFTNEKREEPKETAASSFRAMSSKWRKEYDEVPREEVAEEARFEIAKKHGKRIENYKICLADANMFLNSEFTTPVEKFLKLLKKDEDVTLFEMNIGEIEKLYNTFRKM